MIEADKIYKSLNTNNYIDFEELPKLVHIYDHYMNIDIEERNLHEGVAIQGEPFLRNIYFHNTHHSTGCLLIICSDVVAILPNYDRNGDLESFFLFDSHC